MENKFCNINDLYNEAGVEQLFVRRFLENLGYRDDQIKSKESLKTLSVSLIRGKTALHRPDFALKIGKNITWIVEAKHPNEPIENHIAQAKGYCVGLNGEFQNDNPTKFYLLTNGVNTELYNWDVSKPLIKIKFEEFKNGNKKYEELCSLLTPASFKKSKINLNHESSHTLYKKSLEEINNAFAWCHQHIYKKDAMSQAAAFHEFVKIIFLKLLSDREIKDQYPDLVSDAKIVVPTEDVWFSKNWIESQHQSIYNPFDNVHFRNLVENLETEIKTGRKKRIFDSNEKINLSPETIKGVVEKLEQMYLFGIDADLNGRLFETFLNATMRGKDLGQFFTPRSIVNLGVKIADIQINRLDKNGIHFTESVIDACCGTGGFLIEALADMWNKVELNQSLNYREKQELKQIIALNKIHGIDLGKEPHLARIARMNMYLHGDGGSKIYFADALDKEIINNDKDSELVLERKELKDLLCKSDFDVVITNPPFAKTYEKRTQNEKRILSQYKLAETNTKEPKASLKSSLMFFERYYDILKIGGRIISIIDDGILSGKDYSDFREFIKERFKIIAIISLPGDAFQRSKARVKTSLIVLEKQNLGFKQDSSVFMYPSCFIGIDDPSRQRVLPIDKKNREEAKKEIDLITNEYNKFKNGIKTEYIVPFEKIKKRMDVKSALPKTNRSVNKWKVLKCKLLQLKDICDLIEFDDDSEDTIFTSDNSELITYLRVRYDGFVEKGDEIIASDSVYNKLYKIHEGQIAISGMAAFYGSCGIITKEVDGCVVSSEYLLLKPKKGFDMRIIWLLLRSPEIKADMLLNGTGIARTRIKWNEIRTIYLPYPDKEICTKVIERIKNAEEAEILANKLRKEAVNDLENEFFLNNFEANHILQAYKPPK